jgi:hypothetical protein
MEAAARLRRNSGRMSRRARVAPTIISALLLLVSGGFALGEEGPTASAPLPPPLPTSPPGSGAPRTEAKAPILAPGRDRPPATSLAGPKTHMSKKEPRITAALGRGTLAARKRNATRQPRDHAGKTALRHTNHRALASAGGQKYSPQPPGRGSGSLSPPNDYPPRRLESAAIVPVEPPPAPFPYYPDYPVGRPGYPYAPVNPYAWTRPSPGYFR